jgi:hypothetical protein
MVNGTIKFYPIVQLNYGQFLSFGGAQSFQAVAEPGNIIEKEPVSVSSNSSDWNV